MRKNYARALKVDLVGQPTPLGWITRQAALHVELMSPKSPRVRDRDNIRSCHLGGTQLSENK